MLDRAIHARDIVPSIRSILTNLKNHAYQSSQGRSEYHVRVGLCVSGGPDSMALAYLINTLPMIENIKLIPMAMIVDHHVRPNSTVEAFRVKAELARIGVSTTILNMSWPLGANPLTWSNFESEARTRRYRLIASAALHHRIRHIFTGHHLDDQAETVIMRLASQQHHNLFGLRGIPHATSIPCCDDVHGAHEDSHSWQCGKHSAESPGRTPQELQSGSFDLRLPADKSKTFFHPGGLRLYRPLLGFQKVDLITTCKENNVEFVTDSTNEDATFTRRNAVRKLISGNQLPRALSLQRMTRLQGYAEGQVQRCISMGLDFLETLSIRSLDLTSGTLTVQLPQLKDLDREQVRGLSNAISRLTWIVTPAGRDDMPLQVPESVLRQLFPYIVTSSHLPQESSSDLDNEDSFNFGRVSFRRLPDTKDTWLLQRQPMRSTEIANNTWAFNQVLDHSTQGGHGVGYYSGWKLWDNRFWIRLFCRDRSDLDDVQISPLTKTHLHDLRLFLKDQTARNAERRSVRLTDLLSTSAPGKIRFALPVLTFRGRVIEFPTLNMRFTDLMYSEQHKIRSEVCYKTINGMEKLRLHRSPNMIHEDQPETAALQDILGLE